MLAVLATLDAWMGLMRPALTYRSMVPLSEVDQRPPLTGSGLELGEHLVARANVDRGHVDRYVKAGLISPIDASKVANTANISPGMDWKTKNSINGTLYGIPLQLGDAAVDVQHRQGHPGTH